MQRGVVAVQHHRFTPGEVPALVTIPTGEDVGWTLWDDHMRFAGELARRTRPESYGDLLGGAHRSIVRLETRSQYLIPAEAEALAAFREGRPQPPLPPAAHAWKERIRNDTRSGRRRQRVHVVEQPLTDYLRWEFLAYQHNLDTGEEILIADRAGHPELDGLTEDFYLLDGRLAVLVHYDEDGRLLSGWRTDDADIVHACRLAYDAALAAAVPLAEYLERHEVDGVTMTR